MFDLLDGALADASRGRIDDAQQSHRILRADDGLKIRQRVLHFGALIETEAAQHHIIAVVAAQRFFDLARLEVGAIEHRRAIAGVGREQLVDHVGDEQRFLLAVEGFKAADLVARAGFGPQPLAFALGVVGHHRAGGFENIFGRPVILFQPDHRGIRKVALEVENISDVGAAPAVNRLILIADHTDVFVRLGEQAHQLILAAIGVLILVNHDEFEAAIHLKAQIGIMRQKADRLEQQVVKIERVGLVQAAFVLFVDGGELRGFLIGGGAIDILRRFLVALLVADPGAHGAVLHELFVQAQAAEDGLDYGHLIVGVVDGELARKSIADFG